MRLSANSFIIIFYLRKRVNPIFRSLCFFLPAPSTGLLSAQAASLPCRGSPSAIHEVLILLSRLWADSAYGRLYHSRGFDLVLGIYEVLISSISRRRAFTRPISLRQPIYEVLISFIVLFSAWSFRFLFIGKLCKALLLFTAFCEFQPLLWGAAPFFLPLFRQKATFFVETAQSDSQYLVAFLWKWITFGVRLRPLPASPHLRSFDLVLGIPHVGERYKPRESAPCAPPAERSKPRALEQAESWLSEIKTSQIAARLSVGGEIKTSYIHYIYSIHIVFPEIKTS